MWKIKHTSSLNTKGNNPLFRWISFPLNFKSANSDSEILRIMDDSPFNQNDIQQIIEITMQEINGYVKVTQCQRLEEILDKSELVIIGIKQMRHRNKVRYILQFDSLDSLDAWHLIVKDVYTTFKDEDPVDEEPDLVVYFSDQSGDQISCSMTADLVSRSFPLCHFPFPQGGENTAQELEEVMRNMQVVDLTIKRVQPVENSINYLQFIFFDLNLGKGILSIFVEMFEYVDFHILDQLDCLHYRIDDSELEIVSILNGELIVLEMRLNVCQVIINNEWTTGKNEEPDVEEPESVDSFDNQSCVQASSSSTADLVSPSFPLYVWPSETGDNAAKIIDESCMETIIRVVNLTIRRAQPVEKALKYFQFILFDLNMGEQMYRRIYCHLHDQLIWWYYRIGDSELEIVGKLYGGFIVHGMRLNLPDEWKPSARMVLNHLENDDSHYLNFARSAFKQLNQDLPKKYSHLIKEMMDKPRTNNIRKKKPIVLPSYAYSYKYL
ncbi:Hypothetical protein CINCED_3A024619 [Cinara cedri]|uniref:Uncharacterized protein n=1 Tax=Cinara cedri TaxID=506608 RepID=A0A5E4NA11_9HEMI|nr:Hypothetical protein CINCED_3A024619 [Cinara cedri]